MLQLRTLGTVDLSADGRTLFPVLSQPTRLALLIYLAVARPRGSHRRDVLTHLLWPERDEGAARKALRQTLFRLRRSVGEEVVAGVGEQNIALAPKSLWCDVVAFETAIREERPGEALELYGGPFLKGFHLPDSVEFERWVDRERDRLARRAQEAAWSLAKRADEGGEAGKATRWARHAVALNPYEERGWRRLMSLLDRQGERAAAVRAYEKLAERLERELGIEPSPETRSLLQALQGRRRARPASHGARARSPEASSTSTEARDDDSAPAAGPGANGVTASASRRSRLGPRIVIVLAAVAVGVGASLLARGSPQPEPAADPRSVAVLPFESLGGDPEEAYFSAGITNDIITQLSTIRSLTVVSRTSTLAYEGERRNLREVARELGVARILEGTVQRDGGRVRVTAQLIDAVSDRHLWAESYDREMRDIFAIQSDIARRVAGALEATLTPDEERRLARAPTDDPEAHDLYLKGRYVLERRTPRALRQALAYFRRAVGRDSSFAAAWAGVADAYTLLVTRGALSRAAAADSAAGAAQRALALDEGLAEAHVAMGNVRFLRREWEGQLESFRRAAELHPSYPFVHHLLGHTAAFVEGRLEAALRHVRRAVRLDPLAPVYSSHLANLLYLSRDYEGAARQHRATAELDPEFEFGRQRRRWTILLAMAGRFEEARRVIDAALERRQDDPDLLVALAILHARQGTPDQARASLERAVAAGADSISVGRVYATLGEPERALTYLSASFEGFGVIKTLAWDPLLDPLRSDPRFAALLERVAAEWKLPHLPTTATSPPATSPPASPRHEPTPERTVAVLPFVNFSPEPGQEYFSYGLTEELIAVLARVDGVRVVARTSAFAFRGEERDIREIGRALNVAAVVEGSVRKEADRIRVTAQLIDASDGFHLWSEIYDRRLTDVFEIQEEIALRIAEALRPRLTPDERRRLARQPIEDLEAYTDYLKGRYFWNQRTADGLITAIDYFERAIEAVPDFARAHAGLAAVFAPAGALGYLHPGEARQRMGTALRRALELDDRLAEAHTALGAYRLVYEHDWQGAERAFRRGIELDPDHATARQWYAYLLRGLGRFEEAIAQLTEAVALEPLSPILYVSLGAAHRLVGEFDAALEHLGTALELDPGFWLAHEGVGKVHEKRGEHGKAVRAFERSVAHAGPTPRPKAGLARALALSGRTEEARRIVEELDAQASDSDLYYPDMATVFEALGDRDAAFRWLERSYAQRHPRLSQIGTDVSFDRLREHPRFQDLLRRIGLR